jgi:hypothetical protein
LYFLTNLALIGTIQTHKNRLKEGTNPHTKANFER